LKDVSTLSNPRFGVDRTINSLIRRLLTFYEASGCLFIIADPMSALYSIYDTRAEAAQFKKQAKSLPASLVEPLLALLGDDAVIYDGKIRSPRWRRHKPGFGAYYAYNTTTGDRSREGQDNCKVVADMLG